MLPPIKLIKIALPVATVTTATIATVSLVSSKKEDEKLDSSREDTVLKDFDKPVEEFEEQIMLYSEDGTQESKTISREELEKLSNSAPGGETKGPSPLNDTGESIKGTEGDSEPEGSQSQVSLSDVNRVLGSHAPESDQKVVAGDLDTTKDLTELGEDKGIEEGDDDAVQSGEISDVQQNGLVKEQDSKKDTAVLGDENKKESKDSEGVESVEPAQISTEIVDNKQGDLEGQDGQDSDTVKQQTSPSDDLSAKVDGESGAKNNLQINNKDGQEEDVSGSLPDSQKPSEPQAGEDDGGDSIANSSSGQENGIRGENGQNPITPEKLKEIENMGQEIETVLGALKNLF